MAKTKIKKDSARKRGEIINKKEKNLYGHLVMVIGVVILFATTIFWAYLGSLINISNSDNLVNSQLFESYDTFKNAFFPAQHTFLVKWPIFALFHLLGYSSFIYHLINLIIVVISVGLFAYVIYRINPDKLKFGLICLALSSVLIMVPAQPYPGGLLPTNMAMITTRNIEYLIFITIVWLFCKANNYKSYYFWLAILLSGILIASDFLFAPFLLCGTLFALIFYRLKLSYFIIFVGTILGFILAKVIILVIKNLHLTNIVGANSPYNLITNFHDFALASIYAFLNILMNFGALPSGDTRLLKNVPVELSNNLGSLGGYAYIINLLIFIICFLSLVFILKYQVKSKNKPDVVSKVTIVLFGSSIVAVASFVLTKHYYPVDGRYLAVVLFCGFVGLAAATRKYDLKIKHAKIILIALVFSNLFGIYHLLNNVYPKQIQETAKYNNLNRFIADSLKSSETHVIIGDYWRVMSIKQQSSKQLQVQAMSNCNEPYSMLTSKNWQSDLTKTRSAVLISNEQGLTPYKSCTADEAIKKYGKPRLNLIVNGTYDKPSEQLLFFDKKMPETLNPKSGKYIPLSTVKPTEIDDVTQVKCGSNSIVNVVAHQDDDLLFLSPDLFTGIDNGDCVRTVFLTAGDAGSNEAYWLGREKASQNAYNFLLGSNIAWNVSPLKVGDKKYIYNAKPSGRSRVGSIYFRLPDGNLGGSGFKQQAYESLKRVYDEGTKINSVDKQSEFDKNSIIKALYDIYNIYNVTEVRTQDGDHRYDNSDHIYTGLYAWEALKQYNLQTGKNVPIKRYLGYQVRNMPTNITVDQVHKKEAAFMEYSKNDKATNCSDINRCYRETVYGNFFGKQYSR